MDQLRIGVITFYRDNYGAFLQAYALQQKLLVLGYESELINYDCSKEESILGIPIVYIRKPKFFIKRLLVEILMLKN